MLVMLLPEIITQSKLASPTDHLGHRQLGVGVIEARGRSHNGDPGHIQRHPLRVAPALQTASGCSARRCCKPLTRHRARRTGPNLRRPQHSMLPSARSPHA